MDTMIHLKKVKMVSFVYVLHFLKEKVKTQRDKEDENEQQKALCSTSEVVHIAPLAEP